MEPIANLPVAAPNTSSSGLNVFDTKIEKQFTLFSDLPKEIRLIIWELALPGPRIVEIKQRHLRKTVKDWEKEHGTIWHAGLGLPVEDDIGLQVTETTEAEAMQVWGVNAGGGEADDDDAYLAHLIEIRKKGIIESHTEFRKLNRLVGVESPQLPPAVLFVSCESHAVATKHYTKAFSCLDGIAQTWFDLNRDILFIHAAEFFSYRREYSLFEIAHHLFGIFPLLDIENVRKVRNLAIQLEEYEDDGDLEEILTYVMHIFRGVIRITIVVDHDWDDHRDPEHLRMSKSISFASAQELYTDFYGRLFPDSDSEDETHDSDFEQEIPEYVHEFIKNRWPERPVLRIPPLSFELIDKWWKVLMTGRDPRPTPEIDFQAII